MNMIYVLQTKYGENRGNCLKACLATIFGTDIGAIPELHLFGDKWQEAMILLFNSRGYWIEPDTISFEEKFPNGYSEPYMVFGLTERSPNVRHACIYHDGKLLFDPHPSNTGLTTEEDSWYFYKTKP